MNRDEMEAVRHREYLERQERVFARKQENWRLNALKGKTCTLEQCGKNFSDTNEYYAHLNKHKEEMRRRLVCTEDKCGKKLTSQRAWRQHIEEHKMQLKSRIINGVRSVLLLNKHGLLLEAFEREYLGAVGRPVPFRFMGFESLEKFLVSLTDVLEVRQLSNGHRLLVGLADCRTSHMARMVASQRDNTGGYNYQTSQVLRQLGPSALQPPAPATERLVPRHLVSQLLELVELEARPLALPRLLHLFQQEYSYPMEWQHLGYHCLEDMVSSPDVAETLQLQLGREGWSLALLQEEGEDYSSFCQTVRVPGQVQARIAALLKFRRQGLQLSALPLVYSEWGTLQPEDWGCRNLLHLALSLPHLCFVKRVGQEYWLWAPHHQHLTTETELPGSKLEVSVKQNNTEVNESEVVKKEMNESKSQHKNIPKCTGCGDESELVGSKEKLSPLRMREIILKNVRSVLENSPEGICKSQFETKYEEIICEKLDVRSINFFNLSSFLRSVDGLILGLGPKKDGELLITLK